MPAGPGPRRLRRQASAVLALAVLSLAALPGTGAALSAPRAPSGIGGGIANAAGTTTTPAGASTTSAAGSTSTTGPTGATSTTSTTSTTTRVAQRTRRSCAFGAHPSATTTTGAPAATSTSRGASTSSSVGAPLLPAQVSSESSTSTSVPSSSSSPSTSSSTTTLGGSGATTTTLPATSTTLPPATTPAYYLVESSGEISGYGNAAIYGSGPSRRLRTPIVGGAVLPGDTGYWLLSAEGNLYNFGQAVDYGTPVHEHFRGSITGMAVTPDGLGFVVVSSAGNLYNFGDAPFCGSPVHATLVGTVAGIVFTPDGGGYFVYTTGGQLFAYGDARLRGSGKGPVGARLIGMAPTPDGGGYWLAYSNGAVRQFGDARFYGSAVRRHLAAPITAFAATADGGGYWLVEGRGQMFQFGDATFLGSLAHTPPRPPVRIVAILPTSVASTPPPASTTTSTTTTTVPTTTTTTLPPLPPLTGDPFVHGSIGYDISDFQCAKPGSTNAQALLPHTTGLAVIQVAGWLDDAENSCLASEVAWAKQVGTRSNPFNLYIFMNSPDAGSGAASQSANGPAGRCADVSASAKTACRAYNYGYNGAATAVAYAEGKGVRSSLWWLDIEGSVLAPGIYSNFAAGQYWSLSKALNDDTIQGALDALHKSGATVGIYSTSLQYPLIAGDFVPRGPRLPLWIAGVPWTNPPYSQKNLPGPAALAAWCAGTARYPGHPGTDLFAGGVPWLLQETPGVLPSPYGIDPDYAC